MLEKTTDNSALKMAFLRWQCRTRQLIMRNLQGRPDGSMTPQVWLPNATEPMGNIILLMNKLPEYSVIPELQHMARKTHDPAQRRAEGLRYLSATYYQKAHEFSDILTATFSPASEGAAILYHAEYVRIYFNAFAQEFDLKCKVLRLAPHHPLYDATIAHNALFNPAIPAKTQVLGFEPDWSESKAKTAIS